MCFGDTLACGAPRSEDAGGVFSFGGAGRLLAGFLRAACSALGRFAGTTLRPHSIPSDAVGKASTDPS